MKTIAKTPGPGSSSFSSVNEELVESLLDLSIKEDLGAEGDITSAAIVSPHLKAEGLIICKEPAVIAGLAIGQRIFARFDQRIAVTTFVEDGTSVAAGNTKVALVHGPARSLVSAERLVLNILQRMSGVATTTRQFVELAKPFGIQILDTRKTTPGMRQLQREAVKLGGGVNHRFGLFDAILIKDNHVRIAGGVGSAR